MGDIKTSFTKAGYDPKAVFDVLLLWTYWEQKQGAKYVDIARKAIGKFNKSSVQSVKALGTKYFNLFNGLMKSIKGGFTLSSAGNTKFKEYLVEAYFVSEVGQVKYNKFKDLNAKSTAYNDDPTVRTALLSENMDYEDPVSYGA